MRTIELALTDIHYAQALQQLLARDAAFQDCVVRAAEDDLQPEACTVLVLDTEHLNRLPHPLPHPERIVLITQNAPEQLTRAWEAGIVSVVFEHDPLSTAMLAILSARYRACRS
jgi:hypothetical protein